MNTSTVLMQWFHPAATHTTRPSLQSHRQPTHRCCIPLMVFHCCSGSVVSCDRASGRVVMRTPSCCPAFRSTTGLLHHPGVGLRSPSPSVGPGRGAHAPLRCSWKVGISGMATLTLRACASLETLAHVARVGRLCALHSAVRVGSDEAVVAGRWPPLAERRSGR